MQNANEKKAYLVLFYVLELGKAKWFQTVVVIGFLNRENRSEGVIKK